MARRGRSFRSVPQSQRRKKAWISVKKLVKTPSGGAGEALFLTSLTLETNVTGSADGAHQEDVAGLVDVESGNVGDEKSTLPEECTILRSRGSLLFPKNDPGSVVGIYEDQYAFGMGVTDIRSITQGVVPGPIIDADWDGWMFLRQSAIGPISSEDTRVDVKAMRKIKTGDALFFVAQSVNGGDTATPAGLWIFDMRLLILLP